MSKIKNILIALEFEGNGVVNYDSNDQKYMCNRTQYLKSISRNSNVSFAKKSFTKNDDDTLNYKLKVSSDCLKNDMSKYDMVSKNPNIIHHLMLLYSYIASPIGIIFGYLFMAKDDKLYKKSSVITLCDAEQICNAQSSLEVFSRSGTKESNEGTDKSDNSFYYKETVGNIRYATIGNIDLMKLQLVSCDELFDRKAFVSDDFKAYKDFLSKRMPGFTSELNYYQLIDSIIRIPEYGILLTNENQVFLVKEALKRLLGINIRRKNAYCKTASLKIKLVVDPTVDTHNNPNNWITISSVADIDALTFESQFYYELVDIAAAIELRKEFKKNLDDVKKLEKEEKKVKDAEKKVKNAEKTKKKDSDE